MEKLKAEFEANNSIALPLNLVERKVNNDATLIIAPDLPNWIVLKGSLEFQAYSLIKKGNNLGTVLDFLSHKFGSVNAEQSISSVLIEIANQRFIPKPNVVESGSKCNLTIYLTNRCNLHCIHCYRYRERPSEELRLSTWKRILKQFAELPDRGGFVTFSGGEICLRRDWMDIVQISHSFGLKNVILTNGTLINQNQLEKVLKSIYEIQISIDGHTPKINDHIRGRGTFSRIEKTLLMIEKESSRQGYCPRVAIAITPMLDDLSVISEGIHEFIRGLKKRFGTSLIIRMATQLKPGRKLQKMSSVEAELYNKKTKKLSAMIFNDSLWNEKIESERFSPNIRVRNCGFGQNISIQPNGDVFGCYNAVEEFVGNATDMRLFEIRARLLKLYNDTVVELSAQCSNCDLKYICGGGCRLENKVHTGSYLSSNCCINDSYRKEEIYKLMVKRREWAWQP